MILLIIIQSYVNKSNSLTVACICLGTPYRLKTAPLYSALIIVEKKKEQLHKFSFTKIFFKKVLHLKAIRRNLEKFPGLYL